MSKRRRMFAREYFDQWTPLRTIAECHANDGVRNEEVGRGMFTA